MTSLTRRTLMAGALALVPSAALATTGTTRIHLQQASMQFSDPLRFRHDDLDAVYARGAHIVGHTETTGLNRVGRRVASANGYRWLNTPGEAGLSIRDDLNILDHGSFRVHDGRSNPHGYRPRFLAWAVVDIGGHRVGVCEGHWVTHPHWTAERNADHRAMSREVVNFCTGHRGPAFWMGDTNVNDAHRAPVLDRIMDPRLRSGWDEVGKHPATHLNGHTIDLIGTTDSDRTRVIRMRRWPAGHSDHRPVSMWALIR